MKKLLLGTTFLLCCIIGNSALANKDLCIALNNLSSATVNFSGLIDPGYEYTVKPKESATLSGDHMAGSCLRDRCAVTIYALDGSTPNGIIIGNLPPGTRIIYSGPNQYYTDINAKVKCGT